MRTTVTVDDKLLQDAKEAAGVAETSAVIKLALTAYVQREAARRLAAMGGSDPFIQTVRRRRFDPE